MSILISQNQQNRPSIENVANRIKKSASQTAEQMFANWSHSFDMLWRKNDPFTPSQKLQALGTDAAELFQLNEAIVNFMIANLTNKRDDIVFNINAKISSMPAVIINPDGTVALA